MTIYYILYFILFMMSLLSLVTIKALKKYVLLIMILLLTLMAGIRDGVGTDYYSYLALWNAATSISQGLNYGFTYFEPGFRLLISILKVISNNQIFYYTTLATIPMLILYLALIKHRLNYYVAIFVYVNVFYLAYVFNGMGQAVIISVFLYYFDDFLYTKTFKIFIVSILFVFIHKSAALILIAYLLYYSCKKLRNELLLIFGSVLGIIFYKFKLVPILLDYISPSIAYTYTQTFSEATTSFQLFTRTMILLVLYWIGKQLRNDIFYKNSLKVYIIGYIIYIAFLDYNILATRINMLYRSVEILMFAYAISNTKNFFTKICLFILIAVIYGYSFFKVIYIDDFFYRSVLG